MSRFLPGLILAFAPLAAAASWTNGQAAQAVIGQNSFSAHGGTLNPIGLSIANQQLYVADAAHRVFSYDLAAVLSGSLDAPCAVCLAAPTTSVAQAVPSAQARFAAYHHSVAIADATNHRVLVWRDTSLPSAANGPDLILNIPKPSELASVALDSDYLYVGDTSTHRVLIWKLASLNNGQVPDAVIGRDNQNTGAATIASPTALLSDGRNLFVADAVNHRVLMFTIGDAVLNTDKVVSTASQEKLPFAPGALITLRGDHLADSADAAIDTGHDALPTTLVDTELLIDGRPVPLMAVSPQEIRAQVPYTLNYTSSASVSLRWPKGRASAAIAMPVQSVSPAIFAFPAGTEPRTGVTLHAVNQDQPGSPVTKDNPAEPGETLAIWASGLGALAGNDANQPQAGKPNEGPASPVRAQVDAFVNEEPAEVVSAQLPPGSIGIYEVRILVPADLPPGAGIRLQLREANAQSNVVSIPVGVPGSTIHN